MPLVEGTDVMMKLDGEMMDGSGVLGQIPYVASLGVYGTFI